MFLVLLLLFSFLLDFLYCVLLISETKGADFETIIFLCVSFSGVESLSASAR